MVWELNELMPANEYHDWQTWFSMFPPREDRADLRAGMIASTIANVMSQRGGFSPSDFMPKFRQQIAQAEKSIDELKTSAMLMCGMLGGKFNA